VHVSAPKARSRRGDRHERGALAPTDYGLGVREVPVGAPYHLVAAGTTNAQNVKASAGVVRMVSGLNIANYPLFIKFHNNAGTPTAGVGVVFTVGAQAGMPFKVAPPGGVKFATGIAITIVKGITDADATAVAAGDAVLDVFYE
jgi:hypothetical protein